MATDVLVNFVQRWLKQAPPEHQAQLLPLPEVPPLSRIQNLPLCIVFKCLLLHPTKGCEGRGLCGELASAQALEALQWCLFTEGDKCTFVAPRDLERNVAQICACRRPLYLLVRCRPFRQPILLCHLARCRTTRLPHNAWLCADPAHCGAREPGPGHGR